MSGHSAYKSWRIYFNRAIEKVAPALGKKSNAQLWFSIVLILIAIFGTVGLGLYIDGYVIHPPTTYTGICAPPATIRGGGCFITQIVPIVVNGQTTNTVTQISAGTIILTTTTQGRP